MVTFTRSKSNHSVPYYHFPELRRELRSSKSVSCLLETALACKTFWPKCGQCLAEPALKRSVPGRWLWVHTMGLLLSPGFGQATHGSAIKAQIFSEFSHWKTFYAKQNKFTLNLLKPELWPFFPPKHHPSCLKIVRDLIYFGGNDVEAPAGNSGLLFSRLNLMPLLRQNSHPLLLEYSAHKIHVPLQTFHREIHVISFSYTLCSFSKCVKKQPHISNTITKCVLVLQKTVVSLEVLLFALTLELLCLLQSWCAFL